MNKETEERKFSHLPANRISREELERFPDLSGASKQTKEQFLYIRNEILKCWAGNVNEQLTWENCLKQVVSSSQKVDTNLANSVFTFLERYGYINYGVFKVIKAAPKRNKQIVVVGAGISGIMAARQLKNFGFNVTVLEGRERIGGRMALFSKGPYIADLGAMVITGCTGNPVTTLAQQLNVPLVHINDACHLFDFNGSSVSQQKDELIEKEFNRLLEACAYLAHNVGVDQQRPDKPFSLGETMEIIIQMQEKLVKDKQVCHYKTLCSVQERMISVLHKVNRRKNEINRLRSDYDTARTTEAPVDPEENAIHDFTIRYKRHELEEACRMYGELMRLVDALETTLNAQEQAQPSDVYLSAKDRRMLDWHFANLEFANAAQLDQLSLKNWDQDDVYEFGGHHSTVPSGYANLPILLADGLTIECGAVVKEINIHQDCCKVKYIDESKNASKVLKADAVLCTVPLGVLKRSIEPKNEHEKSYIKFDPPLPKFKVDSISRLGFGNLNKVVLCFDRIFWDPARHMFGYINEKTEARGEFFLFWTIYKEPTVIALVAGKSSLILEHLSDELIVERCLNVLRTIFTQDIVPTPKESVVTRWATDPFSFGSYSFVAVGASGKDYDSVSEPLPKLDQGSTHNKTPPSTCTTTNDPHHHQVGSPKLFFAGEHTCRRYPATVHGALISGLQQAGKIADVLLGSPTD